MLRGDNRRAMHALRWFAALVALGIAFTAAAQQEPLPTLPELEAQGATIGEIRVETQNIFDVDDPHESALPYRAANFLHIKTQPWLIRRLLLFKPGEPVQMRLIDETVRLIRQSSSVYEVTVRPIRYQDGIVDLEVRTRDTWTLEPGLRFRRAGGVNSGAVNIRETNLFGTGTTLGYERTTSVDRNGQSVELSHQHLFDGWTSASLQHARFSDGSANTFSISRPFYALDTRWAAGASASNFDRRDAIYEAGNNIGEYRHRNTAGEVYGGWSRGLIGGWTQRYFAGVNYTEDSYSLVPDQPMPAPLPADRTLAGPYVRYEVLQDDFLPLINRDRIQRPEYFQMGLHATVQVGRSLAAFGATDEPWQLAASLTKGLRIADGHQLLSSLSFGTQYGSALGEVRNFSGSARYFIPQRGNYVLYLATSLDVVKSPNVADDLLLGGDNGLRGYPLRYQRGTRRMLFTAEERYYTDWYPLRLFRVGLAAYADIGRAWGSQLPNPNNAWLGDIGVGLRFLSARAATGNVLHVDLAFPVPKTDASIRSPQLVIMTAKTF
jgi:outer membrane protein assembly factor BamA